MVGRKIQKHESIGKSQALLFSSPDRTEHGRILKKKQKNIPHSQTTTKHKTRQKCVCGNRILRVKFWILEKRARERGEFAERIFPKDPGTSSS